MTTRNGNGATKIFDQEAMVDLDLFAVQLKRSHIATGHLARALQSTAERLMFGDSTFEMEERWRRSRVESRKRHAKSRRLRRLYRACCVTILIALIIAGVVFFL